jgi:hypothetical protein
MTVKQLIEELKKHNPNMNVLIESRDATDYMCKSSIESVEEGHPYNEDGYSGIDDTELDEFQMWLVEIAHEEGNLLDEYPFCVLGALFDLAVKDEQYERAGQIKQMMKLKLNADNLNQ